MANTSYDPETLPLSLPFSLGVSGVPWWSATKDALNTAQHDGGFAFNHLWGIHGNARQICDENEKKKFRKPHCLTSSICGQNVLAINIIICREAQRKSDTTEERKLGSQRGVFIKRRAEFDSNELLLLCDM